MSVIMAKEEYTLSEIFKYEAITRDYCTKHNNPNLSTKKLIELSALEEDFNIDYAFYLQFKRIFQIKEFIGKKDVGILKSLPFVSEDIINHEPDYESLIRQYRFPNKPSIYDKLNAAMNERRWDLVFYIYHKESSDIYNLITRTEDEINQKKRDKKFFIIQP